MMTGWQEGGVKTQIRRSHEGVCLKKRLIGRTGGICCPFIP